MNCETLHSMRPRYGSSVKGVGFQGGLPNSFPALWIVAPASAALSTPHSGSGFGSGFGAPGLTRPELSG